MIFLKQYNRLISFLLSILGVGAACTFMGCEYGTGYAEYGTPNATYKVHGTITDEHSRKLKDIQVIMQRDTAYSDSEGQYQVMMNAFPEKKTYFLLELNDTNSVKSYNSADTTVIFENPDFVDGDGSWFSGETSKEINITLSEKDQ